MKRSLYLLSLPKEESDILIKPKANPIKFFAIKFLRCTKRKSLSHQERVNFVSFQDSRNNTLCTFTNSFEALYRVNDDSITSGFYSQPNEKIKGVGHYTLISKRRAC